MNNVIEKNEFLSFLQMKQDVIINSTTSDEDIENDFSWLWIHPHSFMFS